MCLINSANSAFDHLDGPESSSMRNIGNLLAGGVSVGLIVVAAAVYAAPSDVRTGPDLLAYCPALEDGSGCPEAAASFLQYASPGDAAIVELVISIAEEADRPTVPKSICLDAAAGVRVLAEGTTSSDRRQEILNIADAMCLNSATGAIGDDTDTDDNGSTGDANNGGNGSGGDSSSQMSTPSSEVSQPSSSEPSSMSSSQPPVDDCAGNSDPGNGNNCDNPNNSDHGAQSSEPTTPPGSDCAGNSTSKAGENCDNPNNS